MRNQAILLVGALLLAGCNTPSEPAAEPGLDGDPLRPSGPWDTKSTYSQTLTPGLFEALPVERLDISGADGADVAVALWRPDMSDHGDQPVPLIIHAGPYFGDGLADLDRWTEGFWIPNFVEHGYAFAKVNTRGTGHSGGCIEWWGPNEAEDLDEMVTTLAAQPWSDGQVAMVGLSYAAGAAWMAASFGNPALKSIITAGSTTDVGLLHYRNGTIGEDNSPHEHFGLYWAGTAQVGRTTPDPRWAEAACEEVAVGAVGNPWATVDGDISEGSQFADYWRERDYRQRILDNYRGSAYIVQGLFDYVSDTHQVYPIATELEARGVSVQHMLGQWGHTWPDRAGGTSAHRYDWAELLLRYLDGELRGGPGLGPSGADVQDNLGLWRLEATWPPRDAEPTTFHVGADGLTLEPQVAGSQIAFDPVAAVGQPGLNAGDQGLPVDWTFSTGPLTEELRFAGTPRVHVTVTPQADAGELYADLWHVDAHGNKNFLTRGMMDLKYHAGGKEPQPVAAGQPITARMVTEPVDVVIPAGDELVLDLAPAIQPGPGGLEPVSRNTAPLELVWGDGMSILELPVIHRDIMDGGYPGQPADLATPSLDSTAARDHMGPHGPPMQAISHSH